MRHQIRAVTWDVDGTLYSLAAMKFHVSLRVMGGMIRGRGPASQAALAGLRRRLRLVEQSRSPAGVLPAEIRGTCVDDDLLDIEKAWLGPAISRAGLRPGVRELLDVLRARQIPAAVVSDWIAGYKLDALRISDRFMAVHEGVRIGRVKPSPELFERAAAALGVPTRHVLHIGDRADTDGAGARAAGCQVAILGRDFTRASELAAVLD